LNPNPNTSPAYNKFFFHLFRQKYLTHLSIRNQQVSIFPKTAIKSQKDFEGMLNDTHQFHHEIEISDPQSLLEQTSLERWF
jgi:hypothetical protein